jgi:hypothetical protein
MKRVDLAGAAQPHAGAVCLRPKRKLELEVTVEQLCVFEEF